MKVGLYVKYFIHNRKGSVAGDALVAETLCKNLRKFPSIESAEVYSPDAPVKSSLDVIVYMNDTYPVREWADKHVIYWQNGATSGSSIEERFRDYYSRGYDGYAFFSRALLERHISSGLTGVYLPFCADTSFYYPRDYEARLDFDVAYVGNPKAANTMMRYIYPALRFNFALFGCWTVSKRDTFRIEDRPYRKMFAAISRGRIPEDDVPPMYSSSKIILNTNIPQSSDLGVVSLRTYQVLACKGFLISDPVPGMEDELRGKVVFTEGYDDLADKIKYYLAHEDERRAIAEKGYNYAVKESQSAASVSERLFTYLKELCDTCD